MKTRDSIIGFFIAALFIVIIASCDTSQVVIPEHDYRVQPKVPFNGVFETGQKKDAVFRIRDVGNGDFDGEIKLIVPSISPYSFSFDETQGQATNPNQLVSNVNWTASYESNNLVLIRNSGTSAGYDEYIAIKVAADGSNPFAERLTVFMNSNDLFTQNDTARIGIVSL